MHSLNFLDFQFTKVGITLNIVHLFLRFGGVERLFLVLLVKVLVAALILGVCPLTVPGRDVTRAAMFVHKRAVEEHAVLVRFLQ